MLCFVARIHLSRINDQNFDLADIDHRLMTYLAIFHTM